MRIRPALRRFWRRIRLWLWPPACCFIHDASYDQRLPGVPLDPRRGEMVLGFLRHEGLLRRGLVLPARPASLQELLRVHSPDYLDALQDPEVVGHVFGVELSAAEAEGAVELQRRMTGGTVRACRVALRTGNVAVNLGGGLHHAQPGEGQAFCIFNDIAVAIADLRARGFSRPILVVDLDLHDGNGTRAIFAEDPSVHTFSIHGETWGPEQAVESTCIALGHDVDGRRFMDVLRASLPKVVASFQPELVLYVAGADVARGDELGDWLLDPATVLARSRFVTEPFRRRDRRVPLVVTLSGGYGSGAWRYPARYFSWLLGGSPIEPPPDEEITLARLRRIGRSLSAAELTLERDDYSFELRESDLVGIVPGLVHDTRFLGYFSQHGIELVLERFGILGQLRQKGFTELRLEVTSAGQSGQTLRIHDVAGGSPELLVELRVYRSRAAAPGAELLVIEWLLLQNPRASFGAQRPALPGQQHPGLGMLKELIGALVIVCEILKLDGVFFSPSHYHVAFQSRRVVRFLHPEHEARMRAFVQALRGLPLHEATRLVGEGRVVDASSGVPVSWDAYPMVMPVSEQLKEQVYGNAYEAKVEEALRTMSFRVATADLGS
jgi:acetoin utilization deacetylase AcuC-like enzyme